MKLTIWGARGGAPSPDPKKQRYGGNTSCLSIRTQAGTELVLDGGTGLINLGQALQNEFPRRPLSLHLLLSHFHWDHIQGIPFFEPLSNRKNEVHFYGQAAESKSLRSILEAQQMAPFSPIPMQGLAATKVFHDLSEPEFYIDDCHIRTQKLHHPGGALGYRVSCGKAVVAYLTDTEHSGDVLDPNVLNFVKGVDILVMDANYTPEEYDQGKKGWGHSTWQDAVRYARTGKVKQLILFHHDRHHEDDFLDQILVEAQAQFSNTSLAREGDEYEIDE
jgi:phosphoribosyl 1,2-cyclic phosphodiesterase